MQTDRNGAALTAAQTAAPAASINFASYAAEWIERYTGRTNRGIDQSTRDDYRRSLRMYGIPYIGETSLTDVRPHDIRALVARIEALGQAPSSVRKHLAPVKALLATAVEDGVLRDNPCAAVRVASRRDDWEGSEPRVLTRAELAAFFAALHPKWVPFFELLLHTGVRVSEAIGLRWEDIQLGEPSHIRVRRQVCRGRVKPPKSRYGRRNIPLSPGMVATLAERRDQWTYTRDADPLFASAGGKCLDVSNVRSRVLRPTARRARLDGVGFHTFRHTCASLLFAAGKDLKQVQHWLGHHDPAFTLSTYVHLLEGGLGDAAFFDALASGS